MKILVIQLRRIGDILLTTPVFPYLKTCFPEAEIHALTEPMGIDVLKNNPFVTRHWIYDKTSPVREIQRVRKERYDAVLDFMGNPRTAYLTALSGARWKVAFAHPIRSVFYNLSVPVPIEPEYVALRKIRLVKTWVRAMNKPTPEETLYRPMLYLTDAERNFASEWMRSNNVSAKRFAVLVPIHRHPVRQWRTEGFREVALRLAGETGQRVFFSCGPGEEGQIEELRRGNESTLGVLPRTTLREAAAIMENASVVVTNDSGSMHLAVSVGTPTVTVYGPTRPVEWNPLSAKRGGRDAALTVAGLDCLGCRRASCPIGHLCMTRMSEQTVLDAAKKAMATPA